MFRRIIFWIFYFSRACIQWVCQSKKKINIDPLTIMVVYFKAGGGHLMTANALSKCLGDQGYNVVLVPFSSIFPDIPKADDLYTYLLKKGRFGRRAINVVNFIVPLLTYGTKYLCMIPPFRWATNEHVYNCLQQIRPGEIISCITCTNGLMCSSFKRVNPNIKYTVICSDLRDPMGTWEGDFYDQYIVGSNDLEVTARKRGHCNILRMNGVLLRSQWYTPRKNTSNIREELGFHMRDQVVGVFYGGVAPNYLEQYIRLLGPTGIIITGTNKDLCVRLRQKYPRWKIYGYVDIEQLIKLMSVMDVMVAKPGPGCISEALMMGIPLILEDIQVMRQEQAVMNFVIDHKMGIKFNNWDQVPKLLMTNQPSYKFTNTAYQDLQKLYPSIL